MALKAGVEMKECRLLEESHRSHFMTRRFDRTNSGAKIHMLSLGAMEHLDFKKAGAHSYEQALRTIRELDMPMDSVEEQFRRAAFKPRLRAVKWFRVSMQSRRHRPISLSVLS